MKKYFATGLIALLPFIMTLLLIGFVVNLLTDPFLDLGRSLLQKSPAYLQKTFSHPLILLYAAKLLILLLIVSATLLIGSLARMLFLNSLFRLGERILHRLPFINKIYRTTQQVVKTLINSHKPSFNQVVLVPFPSPGRYSLGVVAGEAIAACEKAAGVKLLSVLVPSSPNPITGFILMFRPEDVLFLDMKTEDAFKYIISCGVLSNFSPHEKFPLDAAAGNESAPHKN